MAVQQSTSHRTLITAVTVPLLIVAIALIFILARKTNASRCEKEERIIEGAVNYGSTWIK